MHYDPLYSTKNQVLFATIPTMMKNREHLQKQVNDSAKKQPSINDARLVLHTDSEFNTEFSTA